MGHYMSEQQASAVIDKYLEGFALAGLRPPHWTAADMRKEMRSEDISVLLLMIADENEAVWRLKPEGMTRPEFTREMLDILGDRSDLNKVTEELIRSELIQGGILGTPTAGQMNLDRVSRFFVERPDGKIDSAEVQPEDIALRQVFRQFLRKSQLQPSEDPNSYAAAIDTLNRPGVVAKEVMRSYLPGTLQAGHVVLPPEATAAVLNVNPITVLYDVTEGAVKGELRRGISPEMAKDIRETFAAVRVGVSERFGPAIAELPRIKGIADPQARQAAINAQIDTMTIEDVAHTYYVRDYQFPMTSEMGAILAYIVGRQPETFGVDKELPVGGPRVLQAGQEANFAAFVNNMFKDGSQSAANNSNVAWLMIGAADNDNRPIDISPRNAVAATSGPWRIS